MGKTTALAQLTSKNKGSLYLSLDNMEFSNDITTIIEEFVLNGGKYLYLDEIHKDKDISGVLKFAYDNFKDLNIVATSSSALEILKSSHDLSRRAIIYKMHGMSFREYLRLFYGINIIPFSLDAVLTTHQDITSDVVESLKEKELYTTKLFKEYLKFGYYLYYKELSNEIVFFQTLRQSIEATIYRDLLSVYPNPSGNTARKLKLLLHAISENAPTLQTILI
ncbi:AAA family ATPase [Campylobacter sputorum]|uniref:AAA family ATPase n=1 Tax=Campylobacter sputorum TaxID=206 RepID=UPI001F2EB0AD|nr:MULTISPECIES: AAA family ATPase [Campylobacter]